MRQRRAGSAAPSAAVLALAAATGLAGCGVPTGSAASTGHGGAAQPAAAAPLAGAATAPPTASPPARAGAQAPSFRSVRTYDAVALPVRLRIPAAGVDTRLQQVGLAADGTIAPPDGWQVAAWWRGGPRPGQDGPAVIVGHVDSRSRPAVFYHLPDLRPGDRVYVHRADGSIARFRVAGSRRVPKNAFPAAQVYSPTLKPSLVLITCGGVFDASTGHYRDNVLVSAVPA